MKLRGILVTAMVAVGGLTLTAAPAGAQGPFHVEHVWKVGGDGGWDYMSVDPHSKLLYITRGDRVIVFDTKAGKELTEIGGLHGIHCVVFSSDGVHGYITDGGANQVAVFDRRTQKIVDVIPVGDRPDGEVFEPVTKTVWAFNGRSGNVTVIDTKTRKVAATIALPGKPEFPVADGKGVVFDNIESKNSIARLDAKTLQLTATWPLTDCESPSGLAIDRVHRRLFSVCHNNKMAVTDADSGKTLANPTIGDGPDAAGYDPAHRLAFSSNGDGTLTVVNTASDKFDVLQNVTTQRGARTMSVDTATGRIYLVTAEFGPRPAATAENPRPRPAIVPGSFTVVVVGR